jgi:hypothetical protein
MDPAAALLIVSIVLTAPVITSCGGKSTEVTYLYLIGY